MERPGNGSGKTERGVATTPEAPAARLAPMWRGHPPPSLIRGPPLPRILPKFLSRRLPVITPGSHAPAPLGRRTLRIGFREVEIEPVIRSAERQRRDNYLEAQGVCAG